MKKASLIFKGNWNGMDVIGYRVMGNLKTEFTPYEFHDVELVRMINGEPVYVNRYNIVKQQLTIGKGVFFKDYIMFFENTDGHKKFREAFMKTKAEYEEFLNGTVCKHINDYYNVSFIKFLLSMYKNKVYGDTMVKQKLSQYMSADGVEEVFSEFKKEAMKESA